MKEKYINYCNYWIEKDKEQINELLEKISFIAISENRSASGKISDIDHELSKIKDLEKKINFNREVLKILENV